MKARHIFLAILALTAPALLAEESEIQTPPLPAEPREMKLPEPPPSPCERS